MKTPLRLTTCLIVLVGLNASTSARAELENVLNFSLVQQNAIGAPAQAADGNYYIASRSGGTNFRGAILRITPSGAVTTVYSFTGLDSANAAPETPLTVGSDGALYGATSSTFFRVTTAGDFQTLATFDSSAGFNPVGNLLLDANGAIYAACNGGGTNEKGTLLKWTAVDGVSLLASFDGTSVAGATNPVGGLCRDAAGNLYGVASTGVVFRYSEADGLGALVSLDGATSGDDVPFGSSPVMGADGKIYLATDNGGENGMGTILRVGTTGAVEVIHSFDTLETEGSPIWNPVFGNDGNLYGLNTGGPTGAGVAWRLTPTGQFTVLNDTVINSFPEYTYANAGPIALTSNGDFIGANRAPEFLPKGGNIFILRSSDGAGNLLTALEYASPFGAPSNPVLAIAPDGGVYGTAYGGGAMVHGAIFHISPGGNVEMLSDVPDPSLEHPSAGVVRGLDGSYYGVAGSIFRYVPGGSPAPFFEQESPDADFTGLNLPVSAADGTLYGSSTYGGDTGYGSIYRLSSTGVATMLASFNGDNTGANPAGSLILAADGNYYGVCQSGGATGDGTIFKVTPAGIISVVATFDADATGGSPAGPLVQAGDGNFYGVTAYGPGYGDGTIFRVTPAGVITVLTTFDPVTQGGPPSSGLTLGSDGLLYGATGTGGPKGGGALFKATLDGQITVLAAFDPAANGAFANKVLQTPDGSFYVPLGWYGPGGYGSIVRYRDSSPTPNPTPASAPPAAPKIQGKTKLFTAASKITIKGTLAAPGAHVEYKVGNGKYVKAKGGAFWKFTARLKLGKNTIYIRSYDPATGKISALKKIVVIRR